MLRSSRLVENMSLKRILLPIDDSYEVWI
jgi:hypothetical protein